MKQSDDMQMRSLVAVACVIFGSSVAAAQSPLRRSVESFPSKPVRWIVPFPPGGAADIVSRVIGQRLAEMWAQQVVVDNRAGAAGNLGIELAARATADGHTVVLVPATFTTYPSLARKPTYDATRDFAPITLVSTSPLVLVVNPAVAAKTVQELIALAKSRPQQLNYASSGVGASAHLAAELFKAATSTQIVHVPYKGQPPAIVDLIAGQVQIMFPNMPSVMTFIKTGKLSPLAVSSVQRSVLFPQLPTIAESGLPGYEVTQWGGLVTRAGTPLATIAAFQRDVAAVLQTPEVRANFATLGLDPVGNSPGEFAVFLRDEITKWRKVISDAGITAE